MAQNIRAPRLENRTNRLRLPIRKKRNVILTEESVRAIIIAAWELDPELGSLVECAAVTGARVSQLARLEVGDLQDDRSAPKLSMPTSKKGRGQKRIERYPVPIPLSLTAKLRSNRAADEPLLLRKGARWRPFDHRHPFAKSVERAGLDPTIVTAYALRHSSVVRQLLGGIPLRLVAVHHNTSTVMLERVYSRQIGSYSDTMTRQVMFDPAVPNGDNFAAIAGRG